MWEFCGGDLICIGQSQFRVPYLHSLLTPLHELT
jgi:hypothetical protein